MMEKVTGEWRNLYNEELMICTPHPVQCTELVEKICYITSCL